MKGVEPLIAAVLIILISVVGAVIVLQYTQPSVDRLKEISLFEESKKILTQIDNAVRTVNEEGEGSTRVLQLSVSGGNYLIDTNNDTVVFSMNSMSQVVGIGISKSEGNVNMFGESNKVLLNISYTSINVTGGGSFSNGYHVLIIRNEGYDYTNNKQIISITPVTPLLPSTSVQYNQIQTLVLMGTNTTSPDALNDLGNNYYIITEASESGGQHNYFQESTANITGFNTTEAYYANSLDNQNYNVTSTVSQTGGANVVRYNQSETLALMGTNTTSPGNLNRLDGLTYNIIEAALVRTQINFTSDLQSGPIQNKVSVGTPALTGQRVPQNWGKNSNRWTNPNYISISDNNRATAATQYYSEDWYNFGFNVPPGSLIYGIRGIVEYSSSSTSATTCNINISNNNGTSYVPMAALSRSSTTDTNTTMGTYTSLWGLTWNSNSINSAGGLMVLSNKTQSQTARTFRIDTLTLEVNYSAPSIDENTSYTTYSNVYPGAVLSTLTNISVTVNVSSYNKTGSSGKNSLPDLWLELSNGASTWFEAGNVSVNAAGNFTVIVTDATTLAYWASNPTLRSIRIRGRYLDRNDTAWDEINYTDVWVGIGSRDTTYRAEIEHNATGVSLYETLNSINISVNFTTNVTSNFNLTIYNFNLGSWNYNACQNGIATAGNWYNWWCNVTSNPSFYNSSDGKIRVILNGTAHSGVALVREDYVQYYVNYTTAPRYANVSVEHNSSSISENPSLITKINVTTILKANASSISFNIIIYNFNSGSWESCIQKLIGTTYDKMECIRTTNPSYYISNGRISVRLNSSGGITTHQMMEDYLVYQITTPSAYGIEVEHNATNVNWMGALINISVLLNFSKTSADTSTFNFMIYNFNSGGWENCDAFSPPDSNWYSRWCNEITSPENYVRGGVIRVRLNETTHQNQADVREDYVQFYVTYTR